MEKNAGEAMSIRLIASDLDETLLNRRAELTGRTIAALRRAMAAGAYVVLASGRMVKAMAAYADQIEPNAPLIAFNGGLIYDYAAGKAVEARRLEAEVGREVARAAEARGVHVQAFTDEEYYFERDNAFSDSYALGIGGLYGRAAGRKLSGWIDRPLCKLLMIAGAQVAPGLARELGEAFLGRAEFALSRATYIECTARGVRKGAALEALCARLGVARDEVAAFGDAPNDLDMLEWAGCGYAVANARPEVRERALPAPGSDEDGVAQVIERLLDEGRVASGRKD